MQVKNYFSIKTSLGVQWLTLHTPDGGGPGSILGQGTRSHMPQSSHAKKKILCATIKTRHSQMNN